MKPAMVFLLSVALAAAAEAVTYHRSFVNGYPANVTRRTTGATVNVSPVLVKPPVTRRTEVKAQCCALTKAGTPCRQKAVPGTRFCRQHTPPPPQKNAPENPREGRGSGRSAEDRKPGN